MSDYLDRMASQDLDPEGPPLIREMLPLIAAVPAPMPTTITFCGKDVLAIYFNSIVLAEIFAAASGLRVSEPYFHDDFARRQVSVTGTFHGWKVSGAGSQPVPDDEREALVAAAAEAEAAGVEAGSRVGAR